MRSAPSRLLPFSVLLPLLAWLLVGCSYHSSNQPQPNLASQPPEFIAAFYELTDALRPGTSAAPRLVICADGHFVCRREVDADGRSAAPSFWIGELTFDECLELSTRERALLAETDFSAATEWETLECDCPVTLFVTMRSASDLVITDYEFPLDEPLGSSARKTYFPFSFARLGYREFLLHLASTSRDLTPCPPAIVDQLRLRSAATLDALHIGNFPRPLALLCDREILHFPKHKPAPFPAARLAIDLPLAPASFFVAALPPLRAPQLETH